MKLVESKSYFEKNSFVITVILANKIFFHIESFSHHGINSPDTHTAFLCDLFDAHSIRTQKLD